MRLSYLTVLLAALALGCASAPTADQNSEAYNKLTAAEITASGLPTAYDVVERFRPRWRRDLSVPGNTEVSVYLDRRRLGGLEALKDIASRDITELRYMKGADAIMRCGQEARGGAISVILR
jgi:uncharacterized protein YigA (DUF484 family)